MLCCNIELVTVFPVTITHGINYTKPANTLFLRETQELKLQQQNGIIFHGRRISIISHCIVCDAPARSVVKYVKGHAGYVSCDRYTQKGYYTNVRLVLNELYAELRENESLGLQINKEHHLGESEFLALDIDIVYTFSIDHMHAVCLEIMKKLLMIWVVKYTTFNRRRYRIKNVHEMNYRIDFLYQLIPSDLFARRPIGRNMVYLPIERYKKDLLPIEYYNNFMCLSISMLILINSNSNVERISYAKNVLRFFINDWKFIW